MADHCPFADSCWMGGGSYACVKTPPFCDSPLIPKSEVERMECPVEIAPFVETVEELRELVGTGSPIESAIKQGELF